MPRLRSRKDRVILPGEYREKRLTPPKLEENLSSFRPITQARINELLEVFQKIFQRAFKRVIDLHAGIQVRRVRDYLPLTVAHFKKKVQQLTLLYDDVPNMKFYIDNWVDTDSFRSFVKDNASQFWNSYGKERAKFLQKEWNYHRQHKQDLIIDPDMCRPRRWNPRLERYMPFTPEEELEEQKVCYRESAGQCTNDARQFLENPTILKAVIKTAYKAHTKNYSELPESPTRVDDETPEFDEWLTRRIILFLIRSRKTQLSKTCKLAVEQVTQDPDWKYMVRQAWHSEFDRSQHHNQRVGYLEKIMAEIGDLPLVAYVEEKFPELAESYRDVLRNIRDNAADRQIEELDNFAESLDRGAKPGRARMRRVISKLETVAGAIADTEGPDVDWYDVWKSFHPGLGRARRVSRERARRAQPRAAEN